MRSLREVGLATSGVLTTEETQYIEEQITKTIMPQLIGRRLMPIINIPGAGVKKYTYYIEYEMSEALISMTGEGESKDRVEKGENSVKVPIISKGYDLHFRDVLAHRKIGGDLNTQHAESAARKVAEDEDRLILTGELPSTGTYPWPAMGIEGLVTATGNLGGAGGAWPTNCIANVSAAKQTLRAQGHYGPYRLVLPPVLYGYLEALIGTTDKWYFQAIGELIGGPENILISNNLWAADGDARDSGMLVSCELGNFGLAVGEELQHFDYPLKSKNIYAEVWEAVVPVIKRPKSIYEITGVTSG